MSAARKIVVPKGEGHNSGLRVGDTIEMGITSVVKIGRDENWISYKITTRLGEGETEEQAHNRGMSVLHRRFKQLVNESVEVISSLGDN